MSYRGVVAVLLVASSLWVACGSDNPTATETPSVDSGLPDGTAVPEAAVESGTDAASDASDAPTDGPAGTIGAGPYSIAYSAGPGIGIDNRPSVAAVVNANGSLESYDAAVNEKPTRGTNQVSDVHADAFSLIGRWNGGTSAGTYFTSSPFTWSATEGFHYGVVIASGALPTSGMVTYTPVAATSATIDDGSLAVGTISAKTSVLFQAGGRKTGIEVTITMPGDATYTATTTGGIADPSQSTLGSFNNSFNGDITVASAGVACTGPIACTMSVRGYVGGGAGANAAARVIFVFVVDAGTTGKTIHGAAVLKAP